MYAVCESNPVMSARRPKLFEESSPSFVHSLIGQVAFFLFQDIDVHFVACTGKSARERRPRGEGSGLSQAWG
jgi:hypothetical protein